MLDPIQIILVFVIGTLTVLLLIIGLEVFQILKEFKKTLQKANKILDDTARITESVAEPIEEASDFILGLKNGMKFLNTISSFFKDRNEGKKAQRDAPAVEKVEKKPSKKRFFTKKGKTLGK